MLFMHRVVLTRTTKHGVKFRISSGPFEVEPDSTPKESMLRCSGKLSWVRLVIDGEDLPDAMQEQV